MNIGEAIIKGTTAVTKEWTTYKKKQYKSEASARRYREQWGHFHEPTIKGLAYKFMEQAYLKASGERATSGGSAASDVCGAPVDLRQHRQKARTAL